MRPLHLLHTKADANSLREFIKYIQIKSGRVNAVGHESAALVSLPVEDVFGDIFKAEDEYYIPYERFKDAKAYSATLFHRDGDTITPYFKDTKAGFPIKLLKPEELDRPFPDINAVLPLKYAPVDKAGVNATIIASIQKILKAIYVKMIFHGPNCGCTIKDTESSNKGFGFVAPVYLKEEDVKEEDVKEEEVVNQEEDDLLG